MNTRGLNQIPAKLRKCKRHKKDEWPTTTQWIAQLKEDRSSKKAIQGRGNPLFQKDKTLRDNCEFKGDSIAAVYRC